MCEFYSPTGIVRRQLVSRQNVMIKPRLNIVAAGHPKRTIECLIGEIFKKNKRKSKKIERYFWRKDVLILF